MQAGGPEIRIEPLRGDEVERMAALAREIWYDHYPAIISTEQIEYMLQQRYSPPIVRAELYRSGIWWDKLLVNGEFCGFSSFLLTEEQGTMKLDKIYLRTSFQRRGYGGLLICRASEQALANSCHRLLLAVNKRNTNAIAAYLKHGFRVTQAVVKEIGSGFVMDDYIMEKDLKGLTGSVTDDKIQ